MSLLTREFRKLDEQVNITRRDLLNRHKRQLELERSLQHAERLATIGTLASGVAHEIGTPMGVIRGRAELMLCSEQTSERIRRGLEVIVSQIDRVSRIVRMLLEYARARESHRSVSDIRQIVNNALSLIDTEAERRNVKVVASLGEQPLISECNAGQLQQGFVFVNLEMNALDAMTPKGGSLRISAIAESVENQPWVTVMFEDTGPGVSPQDASRVFASFFRSRWFWWSKTIATWPTKFEQRPKCLEISQLIREASACHAS